MTLELRFHPDSTPYWTDAYEQVIQMAGGDSLVAHNIPFDRSGMNAVCDLYGVESPRSLWPRTFRPSCRLLPQLRSDRLPLVEAELGIDAITHHDALGDVRTAAHLALAQAERIGCENLAERGSAVGTRR